MREILFRGKDLSTGEWRFGDYARVQSPFSTDGLPIKHLICNGTNAFNWEVGPDTVGQYTGLKDNNGKKIFEGDILLSKYPYKDGEAEAVVSVIWDENGWETHEAGCISDHLLNDEAESGEVIGNIYDNPELLEEK